MIFENIEITTNTDLYILILISILAIGYSIYIYQVTIPQTSRLIRNLLIGLRSFSLILIAVLLFEPVINLTYIENNKPINLLLIDNSTSIVEKDSINRTNSVNKLVNDFKSKFSDTYKIATFGKDVTLLPEEEKPNFGETKTNFDKIIPFVKKQDKNVATVSIISDGIITDGSNSTIQFEKLGIPIFTIPIGDTTKPADISVKSVEFNKMIYLDTQTEISCTILNHNFENKNVYVSVFDKSGVVAEKAIKLNENGINNLVFEYSPKLVGKQFLTLQVSKLEGEDTFENNKYNFVLDVLDNKTNVLIVSSAPSNDLSTLIKSLSINPNLELSTIIQTGTNRFIENGNYNNKINSADIIFIIDFPTVKTPKQLLKAIADKIKIEQKPYFLFISASTDLAILNNYFEIIELSSLNRNTSISEAQVTFADRGIGIIKNISSWQNLPPIKSRNIDFSNISENNILATTFLNRNNNATPLLLSNKFATSKSIIFNGFEFWKWRLISESDNEYLVDSFFKNSIKWLTLKNDKKIFVETNKDIYKLNENIDFIGNVYDETLSPINDATIDITISADEYEKIISLELLNNGIYKGTTTLNRAGKFNYSAKITSNGNNTETISGNILISDTKVENISFVLNSNYLKLLSNITSGKSFILDNNSELISEIGNLSNLKNENKIIILKYEIWNNKWALVLLVLLLSLEWFIRKQKGMI
jgi:hypothetical protein